MLNLPHAIKLLADRLGDAAHRDNIRIERACQHADDFLVFGMHHRDGDALAILSNRQRQVIIGQTAREMPRQFKIEIDIVQRKKGKHVTTARVIQRDVAGS